MYRRLPKRGCKSRSVGLNAEVTLSAVSALEATEVDLLVLKEPVWLASWSAKLKSSSQAN